MPACKVYAVTGTLVVARQSCNKPAEHQRMVPIYDGHYVYQSAGDAVAVVQPANPWL